MNRGSADEISKGFEKINEEFKNYKPESPEVKQMAHYRINMLWDDDADVWVATSRDVPGLVLESESFDALIERLKNAVPELVRLNGKSPTSYSIEYTAERTELVAAYG